MTAALAFRPLVRADQARLWDWLHVALWDPPPAGLRPRAVLDDPRVRIYAEDWGRPGDVGVVAEVDGVAAGACWLRLLPAKSLPSRNRSPSRRSRPRARRRDGDTRRVVRGQ